MELAKTTPMITKSPIPVIGIESKVKPSNESRQTLNVGDKRDLIAVRAYCKAEARGFEPGHEMEDWLAAEAEVAGQ